MVMSPFRPKQRDAAAAGVFGRYRQRSNIRAALQNLSLHPLRVNSRHQCEDDHQKVGVVIVAPGPRKRYPDESDGRHTMLEAGKVNAHNIASAGTVTEERRTRRPFRNLLDLTDGGICELDERQSMAPLYSPKYYVGAGDGQINIRTNRFSVLKAIGAVGLGLGTVYQSQSVPGLVKKELCTSKPGFVVQRLLRPLALSYENEPHGGS
ncbi:hypothetical protein B0H11DRAFT_2194030 [Mycena galericulata]|nr:hypothetical protein B0H11DRAFT_2194030 [Mycena galericulata]